MAVKEKIVITAEDKTAKAFRSVQRSAKKTSADLSTMAKRAGGIAAVGAAAAGALFLVTKRAVEAVDAIGKTADAIGITTDALQEYRYAAELSGVETAKFDTALVQLAKRVGEAEAGTGSLVTFLKQYDESLIGVITSTDDTGSALDAVLDIMSKMESQTDRAAFAAAAFGRSGVALTNILRGGKDSVAAMRDEARKLGLVLDENTVRSAESANDALTRMYRIVSVNLQRVLISLTPIIEDMSAAFADAAPEIQRVAENIASWLLGVDIQSIQSLKLNLQEVTAEIDKLNAGLLEASPDDQQLISDRAIALDQERIAIEASIAAKEADLETRKKIFEFESSKPKIVSPETDPAAKAVADEKARAEAWVAQLQSTYDQVSMTEAELLDQKLQKELEQLESFKEKKLLNEEQYLQAQGALYSTYFNDKMDLYDRDVEAKQNALAQQMALDEEYERWRQQLERQREREAMKALNNLSSLMESGSKKMFQVGKAAAITETVIETYKGAQKAFSALAGIPIIGPALGAAAAAAAIVAGMARVQAIQSTSFGGGRGGGISNSSTAVPNPPQVNVPSLEPPVATNTVPRQTINLTLQGSAFSAETIRDEVIPLINEAAEDGVAITINTTVAN